MGYYSAVLVPLELGREVAQQREEAGCCGIECSHYGVGVLLDDPGDVRQYQDVVGDLCGSESNG
jgi:hypothetical protein